MKNKIYFLLFSLIICSCKGNKALSVSEIIVDNNSIIVCDEALVTNKIDLPLSSLIDSLHIMQLDNRDEAFFKFQWIAFSENY